MSRPGDKPIWIDDDVTDIEIPTPSEQDAGWDATFTTGTKPARQWFNWFWNRVIQWRNWLSGQAGEYIVIDSTAANEKERDYETLAAYIADSPSAGDKVLVKTSQALTAQMIIPNNITLRLLNGMNFTRSTLDAASVIKIGGDVIIEGVLRLSLSHTGITAKAIEINGDNSHGKIIVVNSSTGTVTDAFAINPNVEGSFFDGISLNIGGGAITNPLIDSSTNNSNFVIVSDRNADVVVRSDGAKSFRNGLEFDLGSDADGDVYYRDAGILKKLAKGSDGQVLELDSGIPSWQNKSSTGDIKGWVNFNGTGTISINDSFNVSSIVDNGVGTYTINWDIDFTNTDYCWVGSARDQDGTGGGSGRNVYAFNTDIKTVGSLQVRTSESSNLLDSPEVNIMAIGDQ